MEICVTFPAQGDCQPINFRETINFVHVISEQRLLLAVSAPYLDQICVTSVKMPTSREKEKEKRERCERERERGEKGEKRGEKI